MQTSLRCSILSSVVIPTAQCAVFSQEHLYPGTTLDPDSQQSASPQALCIRGNNATGQEAQSCLMDRCTHQSTLATCCQQTWGKRRSLTLTLPTRSQYHAQAIWGIILLILSSPTQGAGQGERSTLAPPAVTPVTALIMEKAHDHPYHIFFWQND